MPLNSPRIGVVIPAYNASRYVAAAIESVLAQTHSHWQAVVIDDGSADDTAAVATAAAGDDPRFRLVSQENAGRSRARNHGESLLGDTVPYVLFLDADDRLEPAALENLSAYLDGHTQVACVGCQFIPIDESGAEIPASTLRREKAYRTRWVPGSLGLTRELRPDERFTPFVTFFTGSGVGPHAMYRREVFQRVGGYDTRLDMREDQELFMRVSLGDTIHYLPDRLYCYRLHGEQSTSNHENFKGASLFISTKWKDLSTTPHERRVLDAARAYHGLVHHPLRLVRAGYRQASEGKWLAGLRSAVVGTTQLLVRWPYYMVRWRAEVARHLTEPSAAKSMPPLDATGEGCPS